MHFVVYLIVTVTGTVTVTVMQMDVECAEQQLSGEETAEEAAVTSNGSVNKRKGNMGHESFQDDSLGSEESQ